MNWGDGSKPQQSQPGLKPFAVKHKYAQAGTYTVHVTWTDSTGLSNSRDLKLTGQEGQVGRPRASHDADGDVVGVVRPGQHRCHGGRKQPSGPRVGVRSRPGRRGSRAAASVPTSPGGHAPAASAPPGVTRLTRNDHAMDKSEVARIQLVAFDGGPDLRVTPDLLLVGRDPRCDARIDSSRVSRVHCCLYLHREAIIVRDLGSTNGARIERPSCRVGPALAGDVLSIAEFRYRMEAGRSSNSTSLPLPPTPLASAGERPMAHPDGTALS